MICINLKKNFRKNFFNISYLLDSKYNKKIICFSFKRNKYKLLINKSIKKMAEAEINIWNINPSKKIPQKDWAHKVQNSF